MLTPRRTPEGLILAAFGAVLSNRLTGELQARLAAANARPPSGAAQTLGSPEQIHSLPEPLHGIVLQSYTEALETVFLFGIPVVVLGFLAVVALKELPLGGSGHAAKTGPEPVQEPGPARKPDGPA